MRPSKGLCSMLFVCISNKYRLGYCSWNHAFGLHLPWLTQ